MPFGFHAWDLLIVAVIALLIFGPKRLPEMGSAIGKTYKEFRKSISDISEGNKTTPAEPQIPPAPVAKQITVESNPTSTEQPVG